MLTDNPYDSSRNNLPLMRYQITQTHEVLKEFVSHISSFVTRNYVYTDKAIPKEAGGRSTGDKEEFLALRYSRGAEQA